MAISDVILKNGWYITLDSSNKKIAEIREGLIGVLLGFSSDLLLFRKNDWLFVYDEKLKKMLKYEKV